MGGDHVEEHNVTEVHAGSFQGHIVPGTMFILHAVWLTFNNFDEYFSKLHKPGNYRARHSWHIRCPCASRFSRTHLEAILRVLLILTGIAGEIISGFNVSEGTVEFTNQMMHAEHITMFGAFGLASIIDLLQYHKLSWLPDGADYFCGTGALVIELALFVYHLHGRTILNKHVHTLLIYTIMAGCLFTVIEFMNRAKFIWSIPRPMMFWLQGTWFWQIGCILFNPISQSRKLYEDDPEAVMVTTLYFSGHILLAFLVQFVLGGIAYLYRGRPQVQYRKVETNEAEVSGSETWELERADERATLLST